MERAKQILAARIILAELHTLSNMVPRQEVCHAAFAQTCPQTQLDLVYSSYVSCQLRLLNPSQLVKNCFLEGFGGFAFVGGVSASHRIGHLGNALMQSVNL